MYNNYAQSVRYDTVLKHLLTAEEKAYAPDTGTLKDGKADALDKKLYHDNDRDRAGGIGKCRPELCAVLPRVR